MTLKHFELFLFVSVIKVLIFGFPVLVQCTTDANDGKVCIFSCFFGSFFMGFGFLVVFGWFDGDWCG
jgi:hypothetical protein